MSSSIVGVKKLRPLTPGSRGVVLIDKKKLWKGGPLRSLTEKIKKTGGRNNRGVITCRHMGGGHKRIYRLIDFKRNKYMNAIVERIEYDPNRTAFIALIRYEDNTQSYIIAPHGITVGSRVMSGPEADILPGHALTLENIPIGTQVHNVEITPGRGGQIAKSAGSFVQLAGKEMGFAILKMPSGEMRKLSLKCMATVGIASNIDLFKEFLGKAGRNRLRGIRPTVRGVAMNPVDHHNGGRTHGGKHLCNSIGNMRKGKKTRKPKFSDKLIIGGNK